MDTLPGGWNGSSRFFGGGDGNGSSQDGQDGSNTPRTRGSTSLRRYREQRELARVRRRLERRRQRQSSTETIPKETLRFASKEFDRGIRHVIHVFFVLVYLLDFSTFYLLFRILFFMMIHPATITKSIRLSTYYTIIPNILIILHHLVGKPSPPSILIDFFQAPTPDPGYASLRYTFWLIYLDIFIVGLQLFRIFFIHTILVDPFKTRQQQNQSIPTDSLSPTTQQDHEQQQQDTPSPPTTPLLPSFFQQQHQYERINNNDTEDLGQGQSSTSPLQSSEQSQLYHDPLEPAIIDVPVDKITTSLVNRIKRDTKKFFATKKGDRSAASQNGQREADGETRRTDLEDNNEMDEEDDGEDTDSENNERGTVGDNSRGLPV